MVELAFPVAREAVRCGVLFFPAAPSVSVNEGKDITVPEGAEVIAYVDGDRKLDAAKFTPKPTEGTATMAATSASAPAEAPAPVSSTVTPPLGVASETTGLVDIEPTPAAASIHVDGTFMASTPATLKLSPSPHSIRMALEGYKEWTQDFRVETDVPSHLSAQLDELN